MYEMEISLAVDGPADRDTIVAELESLGMKAVVSLPYGGYKHGSWRIRCESESVLRKWAKDNGFEDEDYGIALVLDQDMSGVQIWRGYYGRKVAGVWVTDAEQKEVQMAVHKSADIPINAMRELLDGIAAALLGWQDWKLLAIDVRALGAAPENALVTEEGQDVMRETQVSAATGHRLSCPTYQTLDASDCTCPVPEPKEAWEKELLSSDRDYIGYSVQVGTDMSFKVLAAPPATLCDFCEVGTPEFPVNQAASYMVDAVSVLGKGGNNVFYCQQHLQLVLDGDKFASASGSHRDGERWFDKEGKRVR